MQSIAHHYKLLHIVQEKCETLNRVARGTVMHALDFIYNYLRLHCNAHCCSRQLGSVRLCAGRRGAQLCMENQRVAGGAASPSLDEDCRDCLEIIIVAAVFMLFIGVQVAFLKRRGRHSGKNVRRKKGVKSACPRHKPSPV